MLKSEEMRRLTNEANKERAIERIAKHERYALKIIDKKVRLAAAVGFGSCEVKIRKKYSPTLARDAFERHGFEVKEIRQNGRSIFALKW